MRLHDPHPGETTVGSLPLWRDCTAAVSRRGETRRDPQGPGRTHAHAREDECAPRALDAAGTEPCRLTYRVHAMTSRTTRPERPESGMDDGPLGQPDGKRIGGRAGAGAGRTVRVAA